MEGETHPNCHSHHQTASNPETLIITGLLSGRWWLIRAEAHNLSSGTLWLVTFPLRSKSKKDWRPPTAVDSHLFLLFSPSVSFLPPISQTMPSVHKKRTPLLNFSKELSVLTSWQAGLFFPVPSALPGTSKHNFRNYAGTFPPPAGVTTPNTEDT